ncbi:phosphatidate cytidylyltransferase [Mycoplasma elephantis]|uniref:phosphatidate cytidylyltransferase n=1 Tax=Mycoplasma elephantis TaxID=114882 RepID=UPI0006893F84|nr:phosphatidate cytidylyltransferase [Mycoplasma elephantis]
MNFLKNRLLPGIIFGLVLIFLLALGIVFSSKTNLTGFVFRIIYLFVICSFFVICLYELCIAFKLNYSYIVLFFCLNVLAFVIPFNGSHFFVFEKEYSETFLVNKISMSNNFVKFVTEIFLGWQLYALLLIDYVICVSFFYINTKKTNKYFNISKLFYDGVIFILTLLIIICSLRFIYFSIVFDYRYLVLGFLVAVFSDTSGFFGGRFFGKKWISKPYVPNISPNKTWEGAIFQFLGGFIITVAICFSFPLFNNVSNSNNLLKFKIQEHVSLFVSFILLPIMVIVGDLYFSLIKRLAQIKDFSKILRSHGGFLDRYDSVSFGFFTINLLMILMV